MKTISYIFTLLFLVFVPIFSWGQAKYKVNVTSFTTEDGLSHLDVYCFERDSKGVLWIGTRDGLNRFDGRKFKTFTKESHNLTHKSINLLYRDKDFLWCIHHDRNTNLDLLSIFHTNEEKVYSLEEHLGKSLPFKQDDIIKIRKEKNTLLIYTQQNDTYSYTPEAGLKKLSFLQNGEKIIGVTESKEYFLLDMTKKHFHLRKVTQEGAVLLRVEKKDIPAHKLSFIHQTAEGLAYFGYHSNRQMRKNKQWFRMDKQGNLTTQDAAFSLNGEQNMLMFTHYTKYLPQYNAYWYAAYGTSVLLSLNKEVLFQTKLNTKDNKYSLLDGKTSWIANAEHGFFQLDLQQNKFTNLFDDKKYGGFRGISKTENGILLNCYQPASLVFDAQQNNYKTKPFLGLTTLTSKNGDLWALQDAFLTKYTVDYQKIASFKVDSLYGKGNLAIWAMYEDQKGKIWYSDIGVKSFNPETLKFEKVISTEFPEIEKSITYHFYEKEDGNILLCTTTGLYEMQLGKGIIARYWSGGEGKYHIPADDFRHLYFDKKTQSYWLATNETGLIHWEPKSNTSKSYTFNHHGTNTIHAVYADEFGFLWFSTENGIFQFEKKTGDFKVYSTKEGTSTHEFNRISHFQDEDGKIYFGGIQGVTTFDPKDFYHDFTSLENTKIIPIEINQYKDDKNKIENVTDEFYKNKQLGFYPNDRFLTITFGLNDYQYSQGAAYYYKLKNVDVDWTITQNNEISISGMPYGKQILEVKALLANGKYTKEHLEIPIIVYKPFYLQWWFFVLVFLAILGITLLYIRYRTKKFELQKIALEKEVKKRTLKIKEQTEKLVELDKTKTRFFANVSHELRTPITLIKAPIQSVIKSQKLNQRNEYLLKKAEQNTNSLLNLVNEILDLTKLDNQKLKLKEEKVLFYTLIRQLVSNFQSIAQVQEIEMTLEYLAEKELQILLDKDKFQKIFNNLLSNALKFTPAQGKITITIDDLGREIFLKIADTGRGIPKQDIPHVFERYFQDSQNSKAEGGLGIGLALCMEFIKLFKGKIWLESSTKKENQGTTFFVEFPKKEVLNMLSSQDMINIENDFYKPENPQNSHKNTLTNEKNVKTILIVEDNKDLREYLTFILSTYYQVVPAENGKKAIAILSKGMNPNLIISDLMMPIMDGYEFLEVVKNNTNWSGLPFIMLTARAERQDKLKALRIGIDDYITKPFDAEELLVRIENLLLNYEEKTAYTQIEQENTQNSRVEKTVTELKLKDKKWLEDFENLVIKELNNSLFSIDYLAELMLIDRKTLYKKVKTLTGLTPNQYVRAVRLKLAKDYLENKKYKSSKEVAISLGFKNTTYFSTLFKKEYGKSPSDYLS